MPTIYEGIDFVGALPVILWQARHVKQGAQARFLYVAPLTFLMEYSSRFSQEVRQKLESLKATIDRDLGTLDNFVNNLTFSQADEILLNANSVLDSYRTFMGHLYRGSAKPSYTGRRSGAASGKPRGTMEPSALEMMQGQGYLFEKEFVAKYGFNRNAVSRKLQDLAATYNWKRERTEAGWRYSPVVAASPTKPSAPAPEQTGDVAVTPGGAPIVEQGAPGKVSEPSVASQPTSGDAKKVKPKPKSKQEKAASSDSSS